MNISDDLETKLEEFVCHICSMRKKDVNEFLFNACIWKRCLEASFELSRITDHGMDQNTNILWIKEPFPKDIKEIWISDKCNENEVNDEEDER